MLIDVRDQSQSAESIDPVIYLYATTNVYEGNFGGRNVGDAICELEKPSELEDDYKVLVFVSDDIRGNVKDMTDTDGVPRDLPITSLSNVQIATNWEDLFDNEIDVPLSEAGVMESGFRYWTGTLTDGSTGANCDDFDPVNEFSLGLAGRASDNLNWLSGPGLPPGCTDEYQLLCVAFVVP